MSGQIDYVSRRTARSTAPRNGGLEAFANADAIEPGPRGIRVNTICLTLIDTPLTRPHFTDPAFRDEVLPKIKLGRLGVSDDNPGAAVFLASDASAFMTGSGLILDFG